MTCLKTYVDIFARSLPEKVQKLHIRQSYGSHYDDLEAIGLRRRLPYAVRDFATAMAWKSTSLESLRAHCYIEAEDFFEACKSICRWVRLKSLFLTCWLLTDEPSSVKINSMLAKAGHAALKMPSLEKMENAQGLEFKPAFFKYEVEALSATLTWSSSSNLELEATVQNIWRKVAQLNAKGDLCILMEVTD